MTRTKNWFSIILLSLLSITSLQAQDEENDPYKEEVQSLVSFYKYMLNTVGGNKTSTRDKEVIITESYKKAFKDGYVQIEDDLLPDRNAITNKDISAYLRDVDFFFRDIKFDFEEIEITKGERDNGKDYYLVSFQNTIDATTLEGEPYQRTAKRYIEVNFDSESSDLKIVSVYSTKISREKELRNWWESLSFEWTRIFKEYVPFDSATNAVLIKIADLDSLNLSDNQFIQSIKPLSALKKLTYLNISNTKISDLTPLRYSPRLNTLVATSSAVNDISVIQYFEGLQKLELNRTNVTSIEAIANTKITDLNLSGTNVIVFNPLNQMSTLKVMDLSNTAFSSTAQLSKNIDLQQVDLSRTGITSIQPLSGCQKLNYLNVSESYITDLKGAEQLRSLTELHLNQTRVTSLGPLSGLKSLKKVYADYTGINERAASDFMAANRGVLVITNSEKIMDWWNGLAQEWKLALGNYLPSRPSKEDIAKLINSDSLDLSNNRIVDGSPLARFSRLRYLDISRNLMTDFDFTAEMEDLEFLKAEKMPATSTTGLEYNKNLKFLILTESIVKDIQPLEALSKLELLDVEATAVSEMAVKDLLRVSPNTVVIYQPNELQEWWDDLQEEWKKQFDLEKVDSYHLHQLIESQEVIVENSPVSSLSPLDKFINLRKVYLDKTGVTSLIDLTTHEKIEEIVCKNGPLMDLESIEEHYELKKLDISNTAVDDLRPLRDNRSLNHLNCSGTNIKNLKGIEELYSLNYLDISNTRVWRMDRLYDIRNLNILVCYNTRIRARTMDEFKTEFPEVEITYY
ncbi:MAG: hypothetical protein CMB80_18500 [Flammeovirgaceae bacterium]|nr:hypothetical protein [Flammeovirgaceae bacterium]|tara:strand:- start:1316 stop:3712 length:2397 start_codon:yes stop_codon:yes gene_type:complete